MEDYFREQVIYENYIHQRYDKIDKFIINSIEELIGYKLKTNITDIKNSIIKNNINVCRLFTKEFNKEMIIIIKDNKVKFSKII